MRALTVSFALAAITACAAVAHADNYYYGVDRSVPENIGSGNVSVRGALKVDALGAVQAADISS